MAKKNFYAANVLCLIAIINSVYGGITYRITAQFSGAMQAAFDITSESDDSNWELELKFDDKVKLNVMQGAKVKSGTTDEMTYVLAGDPIKSGAKHTIAFEARYDNNPGANLISAKFNGKAINIGVVSTSWPITVPPIGTKGDYNYKTAIHASLLFYEAQRSGKLPADNRIHWRGDSMLDDADAGHDLSGGYHDAGDLVKFNFPMAYAITVVSWGVVDYEDAYIKAGELENVHKMIKWGTDYFIKCHTGETELYGQVGNGGEDHAVWSRPEDWPKGKKRPAYKVTADKGGSDLVGETAAAMAAASIVFKKSDPTYSATLLKHAKSLYTFADKHRGTYTDGIPDAAAYYKSWSGFGDELAWSAAWLLRATNETAYKSDVDKHFSEFSKQLSGKALQFSWDDKTAGVQVLLAKITGDEKYKGMTKTFCDWVAHEAPKSPKGMVHLDQWGPLRHAANAAWICLQAGNLGINAADYKKFAESQIGYILGDTGRSFLVGVGVNPPVRPHHRAASCPNEPVLCDFSALQNKGPNPHILTGALVGGPDGTDAYNDQRDDYVHNEVAMDYNAGFQSALAALLNLKG